MNGVTTQQEAWQELDNAGSRLSLIIGCSVVFPAYGKNMFMCKCGITFPVYMVKGGNEQALIDRHNGKG